MGTIKKIKLIVTDFIRKNMKYEVNVTSLVVIIILSAMQCLRYNIYISKQTTVDTEGPDNSYTMYF